MRIVFLGDSLTWGRYGGDFVAEIAQRLPEHEIINSGESGNTSLSLLNRLDDVLALEPDGIFVMVGGNDAISYSQPETRRYYQQVQKIPDGIITPELFSRTYRELLTQIQLNYIMTWVGLAPKEYNPAVVEAAEQFNALAREIAESLNIAVLDFMPHFKPEHIPDRSPLNLATINLIGKRANSGWSDYESARAEGDYTYSFDGLHITPESAPRFADLIIEFLRQQGAI
jgi:lysophospholipase L1-like esterase